MEQITYQQACKLLGVKYVTVKDAVLYGKLTRCAYPEKQAMLLREQVELFKGKRISVKALSLEDRQKWEGYKRIAENMKLPQSLPSSIDVMSDDQRLVVAANQAGRKAAAAILTGFVTGLDNGCWDILEAANIERPKREFANP